MNLGSPPFRSSIAKDDTIWNQWFLRLYNLLNDKMNVVQQTANPTTSQIAENEWLVVKNTTSGDLKLWVNDNGTLKSVTLT